jgi:prefoldin alpha subunit
MNDQELQIRFQAFEQQIMQLQQQLQAVERAISEIGQLSIDLDGLQGNIDKEILSPIGRGVFVKTKLISEDLIVDVGGRNFVKKNVPETKKIIEEQIEKLNASKEELNQALEELNQEITQVFMEHQKSAQNSSHSHDCECGDDCKCAEEDNCGCGHKH